MAALDHRAATERSIRFRAPWLVLGLDAESVAPFRRREVKAIEDGMASTLEVRQRAVLFMRTVVIADEVDNCRPNRKWV